MLAAKPTVNASAGEQQDSAQGTAMVLFSSPCP